MDTPDYDDLLKHFGTPQAIDKALTRAFLGYRVNGAPKDWDWTKIIYLYHRKESSLLLLLDIALRKIGVDVESELY